MTDPPPPPTFPRSSVAPSLSRGKKWSLRACLIEKVLPGKTSFELGANELTGSVPSAGEVSLCRKVGKTTCLNPLFDDSITRVRKRTKVYVTSSFACRQCATKHIVTALYYNLCLKN